MKKIFFICLLAVFTLSLAGGFQANAATLLTSKNDVYNLFKKDMANRWGDLNSTANRRTGSQGVYDLIVQYEKITYTLVNTERVGDASSPLVYSAPVADRLNWFKTKFIEFKDAKKPGTTENILEQSDKNGIAYAMKARLADLGVVALQANAEVKTLINAKTESYNKWIRGKTEVNAASTPTFKSLITLRKEAIDVCNAAYTNSLTNQTLANPDYTVFGRWLANINLVKVRDACINLAWTNFYGDPIDNTVGLVCVDNQKRSVNSVYEEAHGAYTALPAYVAYNNALRAINVWSW